MGKLSTSRIFDTALIATTKAFQDLQPFIEWMQNSIEMFYRTINGNITISENLNATIFKWTVRSNSTRVNDSIRLAARPVIVLVGGQSPRDPIITAFSWSPNDKSGIDVSLIFASAPTSGVEVAVLAFFG